MGVISRSHYYNRDQKNLTPKISSYSWSISNRTALTYAWSRNPLRPSPHRKTLGPNTIARASGVILLPSELLEMYNMNSHRYLSSSRFSCGIPGENIHIINTSQLEAAPNLSRPAKILVFYRISSKSVRIPRSVKNPHQEGIKIRQELVALCRPLFGVV